MAVKFFRKRKPSVFYEQNELKLFTAGVEYFDFLVGLIDSAKQSVHIQTYIFLDDETGRRVADALIRAAKREVKVYVLVDAYGSQSLPMSFIEELMRAGIYFRKFRPFYKTRRFYLGRRLHHKIVVVDGIHSTVGGLNIADRYNDTDEAEAWLDFALYAKGEVASQLEDICIRRLKIKVPKAEIRDSSSRQVSRVRIRVNDWVNRKREIYRTYLDMFRTARSRITLVSAYFLPGHTFRKALEGAAKRGVKIRIILTGSADVPLIKYAERYIYRWLLRNNVELYEYRRNVLHAKLASSDGEFVTVGSFNVNNLSAYGSIECNLDVDDSEFASLVEKKIDRLIEHDCIRVTEEDLRKRNIFQRAGHFVAYELFRFAFVVSTKHRE